MNDYRAYVEFGYNEIYHHGVKGMKWGERRWQNPDGSLTPEGRRHYGYLDVKDSDTQTTKNVKNDYNNMSDRQFRGKYQVGKKEYAKRVKKYGDPYANRKKIQRDMVVKGVGTGLAVAAGVALTAAALSNPGTREAISSAGKAAYSKIMNGGMENISGIKNFRDLAYTTNYADIGQSAARLMQKKQYLLEMKVA